MRPGMRNSPPRKPDDDLAELRRLLVRPEQEELRGLQERLEFTTDPERVALIEQQLRVLEEGRTAPFEALAGWYQGLPDAARAEHEDFARRCTAGGVEALLAARPAAG